ncbi:MAG: HAMP domain-containing histidine kinase [Planctomycetota bacterium]|jgi:signal transduction histidine kinase|nr:HAMP domain-containing histidine kinase [Planctomycetota bacterium]
MTLRRKILVSFIMMTVIHGLATLSILQATYMSGDSFQPENGGRLLAPGLFQVAASLGAGLVLIAYLLFASIQRLILGPIDDLLRASSRVAAGETAYINTGGRSDEIGQLSSAFNRMAESVLESRLNLEDKVKEATDKIERTQRDLAFTERLAATGRLAAGVAHEINNPLGGVMNAVARLRREIQPSERSLKYLDICDNGLRRIQETVRRILDFSRKRPEAGVISVTVPLLQSIELIRHLLAPNRVALSVNIEESRGKSNHLRVEADVGDLQHVFLNLLMNAIDAMPNGGSLTLNVQQVMRWVLVEIIDTGTGLTLEELSASFDYFHTTKPVGRGTGLGLSIARHIVVGYNGSLTLNSQKGVGTKASVELPAVGSSGTRSGLKNRSHRTVKR